MKARILLPLVMLCCASGCDDLVEVLDEGFIHNNEKPLRHCVSGEWVGKLPKTSTPHHCEQRIFFIDTPSYYTFSTDQGGDGNVKVDGLYGYLAGELGVATSTKMTGKLAAIRRWLAVHERHEGCSRHDDVCQDEYVVRNWNLVGRVFLHSTATATAQASLERKAKGDGVSLDATLVTRGGFRHTQITVGPVLLCEDAEHQDCASRTDESPDGTELTVGQDGSYLEFPWKRWDGGTAGAPTTPPPTDWFSEDGAPMHRDGGTH